jgi:hypothetical protein
VPPLPTKVDNADNRFFVSLHGTFFAIRRRGVANRFFREASALQQRKKAHRGRRRGPIKAIQDSDARNHRFARHPALGEARRCA